MSFDQKILKWFDKHGRTDLPWQINPSPYRVWISEIMLQQTQVTTVIPYFLRFLQRFPDINTLALAPLDAVLELWTGLGYYSRARNCHKTAIIIHTQYHNRMPATLEALMALPGIGRSTAGAILALSFQKQYPILDGNVKRVLCRYYAIQGWPGIPAIAQQLWNFSEKLTPKKRVHHYTQAMMDLGATLCKRSKPNCPACPLKRSCKAYQNDTVAHYPESKPKKDKPLKKSTLLMLRNSTGHILLEQRPSSGIWGGLWSFPEHDLQSLDALTTWVKQQFHYSVTHLTPWKPFRHSFTHFDLDIYPVEIEIKIMRQATIKNTPHHYWHPVGSPLNRGVSTPIKRLLTMLKNRLDAEIQNRVK